MTNEQLWQAVLGELELLISRPNFTTWFSNTFVASQDENSVVIGVPNTFTKAWLESKYHESILKAVKSALGSAQVQVSYKVESPSKAPAAQNLQKVAVAETPVAQNVVSDAPSTAKIPENATLNPRYTFGTFITGKSNELAKAACVAVAERPGLIYNPLFIYGGAGLGKTHLMQAIGHQVLAQDSSKRVLYVSSEKFTNEFIRAISKGNGEEFKNRYRGVDVLLVDDIQFLAGKEGTQEEFFHTFNALHQANKQIIITSDRPPKSIPSLENRLVSRFEWGMIADIAQPDLETRIAILDVKCREKNLLLSSEILHYIGTNVQSNIRELEGALNRVVAYQELSGKSLTMDTVKELLSSVTRSTKRGGVTPRQVIEVVADFYELEIADLLGVSRKKELVVPRQIAMYLMREELQSSFPSIGYELGNRDHTTAMHAVTKISGQLREDERLQENLRLILQRLYGSG
ncbi:MAG: chromosomal replication initiator protein DnaA [Candidatus Nomurabacteria bacterium]|nr:MAG: chromosomal replication initiator protein DnaA [Candidatus Nomurabacteria bacterium]